MHLLHLVVCLLDIEALHAFTGLMSGLLESERKHRQHATHQAAELQQLQQQA